VLGIDEASLTNWPNLLADNFGFTAERSCDRRALAGSTNGSSSPAPKLTEPARKLLDAAKANGVALIFITGRADRQRDATILNLNHAGFEGWTEPRTRPDRDDLLSVQVYKTAERT
jgi:HAD superfamily, subfamily IIIB (Acid phosphatase)